MMLKATLLPTLIISSTFFNGCGGTDKNITPTATAEVRDLYQHNDIKDERAIKKVTTNYLYKSEKRSALVIGNNSYITLRPLKNAKNDSSDMANVLRKLGFSVTELHDTNRDEMLKAIEKFGNQLKTNGGVGLLFYAGHGLEMGGTNYLIPTNADIDDKLDIKNDGISLNDLLYRMENAGNRLNIIVLDACRNDPFVDRTLASRVIGSTTGLSIPPVARGTYIAYSADIGQEASDGTDRNGLFTKHLLSAIQKENVPLNDVFKLVRDEVEKESDRKQSPASYDKTVGEFFFTLPLSANIISETNKQTSFSFSIQAIPSDSIIEFIDYDIKYTSGMFLKNGNYKIKISRDGYLDKTVELKIDRNTVLPVQLQIINNKNDETINSGDFIVWSGEDIKYPNIPPFLSFEEAIKVALPKDEFETAIEYKVRVKKEKSEVLNSWFGKQNISMNYNPESEFFAVNINHIINFDIAVPRNEAKDFKSNVKNFTIFFKENNSELVAVGGTTLLNNKTYRANFKIEDIYRTKRERERQRQQLIKETTLTIDNLMFQDAELPESDELAKCYELL